MPSQPMLSFELPSSWSRLRPTLLLILLHWLQVAPGLVDSVRPFPQKPPPSSVAAAPAARHVVRELEVLAAKSQAEASSFLDHHHHGVGGGRSGAAITAMAQENIATSRKQSTAEVKEVAAPWGQTAGLAGAGSFASGGAVSAAIAASHPKILGKDLVVKPSAEERIDPVSEWHRLRVLQVLVPFLLAFVVLFECWHLQWSDVDWGLSVEYPEELRRIEFTALFRGAWGWLREFLTHPEGCSVRSSLLVTLGAFFLASAYIKYSWTLWNGRWYNLLQFPHGNFSAFWPLLGNFVLLVAVDTFVAVYQSYVHSWLMINWKTFMVRRFQRLWLSNRAFYIMELHTSEEEMDNPDQRISEDATGFCDSAFVLGMGLMDMLLDLIIYVPMLLSLSPSSVFGLFELKGWLLYMAVLWAVGGTLLTYIVGRPLIALKYSMQRYHADYRFGLMQVRNGSESVAMLGGEAAEERRLGAHWENIRRVTWESMLFSKRYSFIEALYNHAELLIGLVVLVPAYLNGEMTLGSMRMAQSALASVKGDLRFVVNSWGTLTSLRAQVARLQTFEHCQSKACAVLPSSKPESPGEVSVGGKTGSGCARNEADNTWVDWLRRTIFGIHPDGESGSKDELADQKAKLNRTGVGGGGHGSGCSFLMTSGADGMDIRGLTIRLPTGTRLVFVKEFAVSPGDRVLLSGPVGAGKSTFLRALSGIWPHIELSEGGRLVIPDASSCLFVPRVPALPATTLRDLVCYPELPGVYSDKDILGALAVVGLEHVVWTAALAKPAPEPPWSAEQKSAADSDGSAGGEEPEAEEACNSDDCDADRHLPGLDRVEDWAKVLSGGEQQRALLAHVILRRPRFVFLDEATSSMGRESALALYGAVINALGPEAAIVSISHDVEGMLPLHTTHFAVHPRTHNLDRQPFLDDHSTC